MNTNFSAKWAGFYSDSDMYLHNFILCMHILPVADSSTVRTCTVVSVSDELLRISTGCNNPLSSLTL